MAERPQKLKLSKAPKPAALKDGPLGSLPPPPQTVAQWAQGLIASVSGNVSVADLAILRSQADGLSGMPALPTSLAPDPTKPSIVRDREVLNTLATKIAAADEVVVDLETSSLDPRSGVIVGIGFAIAEGAYYIPVSHCFEDNGILRPNQMPLIEVLHALHLQDKPLVNHNVKFEIKWLRHHGHIACRFVWDTMIAARLLRSDRSAELKDVASGEFDVPDWDMPKADKQRIQCLPVERVATYCAKDCWYTLQLYRRQRAALSDTANVSGLNAFLIHEVEMPLVDIVVAMEDVGYLVDAQFFHDLRARLEPETEQLLCEIRKLAKDPDLNLNSPKQLRELLYEKLALKPIKWTPSGDPSTEGDVLKRLKPKKKIVTQLVRARELQKVLGTYCDIPNQLTQVTLLDARKTIE